MQPPSAGLFANRTRFLLLALVISCLMINWANILTFNFTMICMEPPKVEEAKRAKRSLDGAASVAPNLTSSSSTAPRPNHDDAWLHRSFSPREKSQAMGVVAAGALIANFLIVILINWYGPRVPFTVVGLFGAAATAAIPSAMHAGFEWFLAVRFLQGIAFAGDMATFGHFIVSWTYHKQYAFFTSSLCVYVQLAPIFTNPISGLLCNSSVGWPGVYYFHATVAALLFSTFFVCFRNHPSTHPFVNDVEKMKIARGRDKQDADAHKHVPYVEILRSTAFWAVFVSAIGAFSGINLIYQFMPTYLHTVHGFAVVKTGLMAAVPPVLQAIMKELSGLSNDRIPQRWIGEKAKTRLYNSIAMVSLAGFLIALGFVPPGHGQLAFILLSAGACMLGFITGGFYKSGSIISGPYAPFVLGQVSTAIMITLLVVPLIVNSLTPNNTEAEWSRAFWVIAALILVCNTFYVFFAQGEPEPWARVDHVKERMEIIRKKVSAATITSDASAGGGEKPIILVVNKSIYDNNNNKKKNERKSGF